MTDNEIIANGGWADFKGDFDTLEEARKRAQQLHDDNDWNDWHHIVDTTTLQAVGYAEGCYCGVLPDFLKGKAQ